MLPCHVTFSREPFGDRGRGKRAEDQWTVKLISFKYERQSSSGQINNFLMSFFYGISMRLENLIGESETNGRQCRLASLNCQGWQIKLFSLTGHQHQMKNYSTNIAQITLVKFEMAAKGKKESV